VIYVINDDAFQGEEGGDAQGRRRGAAGDPADQGGNPRKLLQEAHHQRIIKPLQSA
jgi:hypothetical protein